MTTPKFRRRKADRPAEIVEAALQVFAEKGFAGAKLDEIAARAGVSKGALYLYFETKQDLFRAVVAEAFAPNLAMIQAEALANPARFEDVVRLLAGRIVQVVETRPVGGVLKMVIGEARNFPELARVWYENLISRAVVAASGLISAAQARGEVRAGDPRIFALQLISPILVSVIWRETFTPVGAPAFDLKAVLDQHIETFLAGVASPEAAP